MTYPHEKDQAENDRITELARQVAKITDGWHLYDTARVGAMQVAFSIGCMPISKDERRKVFEDLVEFMLFTINSVEDWGGAEQ